MKLLTSALAIAGIVLALILAWNIGERSKLNAALTVATDSLSEASARLETAQTATAVAEGERDSVDALRAAERVVFEAEISDAQGQIDELEGDLAAADVVADSTAGDLDAHLAGDPVGTELLEEHLEADAAKDRAVAARELEHEREKVALRGTILGLESKVEVRDGVIRRKDFEIDKWAERYGKLEDVNAINVERAKGGIRIPLGIRIPDWVGYAAAAGAGIAIGRGM